ncbi:hypothetical protein [Mucilaginibacter aurantiaciroseus]|nr:hypothetical protein [Mucilaginibacter aurantiaciroseus]
MIISGIIFVVLAVDHGDLGTGWGFAKIKSEFIAGWFYGPGV